MWKHHGLLPNAIVSLSLDQHALLSVSQPVCYVKCALYVSMDKPHCDFLFDQIVGNASITNTLLVSLLASTDSITVLLVAIMDCSCLMPWLASSLLPAI